MLSGVVMKRVFKVWGEVRAMTSDLLSLGPQPPSYFLLIHVGKEWEAEGRLGKGQGREAQPHFTISVEKAAVSGFCCQQSHRDGPHESLLSPASSALQSLLWSAAWAGSRPSPQCSPTRPLCVPISICTFAILGLCILQLSAFSVFLSD